MPAFRYEAIDANGHLKKGALEADSLRLARTVLRSQQLIPVSVTAISKQIDSEGKARKRARFTQPLSASELGLFTRQLASLLEAGLPLEQTLLALLEQTERPYLRDLIASIRSEITSGAMLTQALSQHPHDFADIYRALVASGEQTGQLPVVLSRLADYLEQRNVLLQKIRLAFTYPAVVTVVAFAVIIFLLTYVVPQIVTVFVNTKQKLPLLTIAMLALSDFIRQYGLLLAASLLGLGFVWRRLLKNPAIEYRWHAWLLNAPLYGKVERSLNTARFARTLAITVGSGVPILQALQTSQATLSNRALKEQVEAASVKVREGVSLARALSVQLHFPSVLLHMIRAGEETGNLAAMLERAAVLQEQELERRALFFAGLLEPALILVMGVIVLLIVLAVLMPIIEINQLVR